MAYTMEPRTVCAHKQGRMMSIFARNMTRSAVEQEAKLLFSYVRCRPLDQLHPRPASPCHPYDRCIPSPPWCRHR
jgi:hypothetical protein